MEKIIINNSCLGFLIHKKINNGKEYNNPFVGSLFVNDFDFLKLCNKLEYYLNLTPVFKKPRKDSIFCKQNNGCWYKHNIIKIPYPVMFLDDIEIHWIHEKNEKECLVKYLRRQKRFLENKNLETLFILSFSELINDHDDTNSFICSFLENKSFYFLGPSKYYKKEYQNRYIINKEWDNIELKRNSSHVYNFNDQYKNAELIFNHLNK